VYVFDGFSPTPSVLSVYIRWHMTIPDINWLVKVKVHDSPTAS